MKRLTVMLMFALMGSLGNRLYAADDDPFEKFIKDNRLDFIKRKPMVSGDKVIAPQDAGNLKRALFELMEGERYSQDDRSDIVARLVKKVNLHADIPQKSLRQVKKTSQTFLQHFLETACYGTYIFNEFKRLGFLEGLERESGYILDALKLIFNVGVKPKAQDLIYAIEEMKGVPPSSSNPFNIMIKHADVSELESVKGWLSNSPNAGTLIGLDKLKLSVNGELSLRSETK